jgi:hypothetical protein
MSWNTLRGSKSHACAHTACLENEPWEQLDTEEEFKASEYLQRACRICHETLAPHHSRSPVFRDSATVYQEETISRKDQKPRARDKGDAYELIAPCRCKGTIRWVHRMCLDMWRVACYRTEAYDRCEQCRAEYQLEAGFGRSIVQNPHLLQILSLVGVLLWGCFTAAAIEITRNVGTTLIMDGMWRDLAHSYQSTIVYGSPIYAATAHFRIQNGSPPTSNNNGDKSAIRSETSGERISRLLLEAALGVALTEVLIVSVSVPLVVNLGIILYRTFGVTSSPTKFDYVVLSFVLACCLYFAYRDMLKATSLMARKLTCTRIRNLVD